MKDDDERLLILYPISRYPVIWYHTYFLKIQSKNIHTPAMYRLGYYDDEWVCEWVSYLNEESSSKGTLSSIKSFVDYIRKQDKRLMDFVGFDKTTIQEAVFAVTVAGETNSYFSRLARNPTIIRGPRRPNWCKFANLIRSKSAENRLRVSRQNYLLYEDSLVEVGLFIPPTTRFSLLLAYSTLE